MGPIISNVLSKVAEQGLETGFEKATEQAQVPVFRRILYGLIILGGLAIAIISLFFWQSDALPGVSGLIQAIPAGKPAWFLLAPICSFLMVIVALLPVKGRHTITILLSIATCVLAVLAISNLQNYGATNLSGPTTISMLLTFLLPIAACILALSDIPAIESPLAPITWVYFGRLRHLRTLQHFAQAHGWHIAGPAGRHIALTVDGPLDDQHTAIITSGVDYAKSSNYMEAFSFSVKITSRHDILALRINRYNLPEVLDKRPGLKGATGKPKLSYYLQPLPELPIPPGFTTQLESILEEGRPYLKRLDDIRATPFGLRYTHLAGRLKVSDGQPEALLQWLLKLTILMDAVSPAPPAPPKS